MALPSKYGINKGLNSMAGLSAYENGGSGSGNFGHAGRPGKRGGSGKGDYYKDLLDTAKADMMHAAEEYDRAIEDGDQSAIQEADAERVRTEEFYDKLKREMPERAKDPHDWFKTVQEIKEGATEERRKELDEVIDEVGEAIYETDKDYIGSKKKTLDFIEANILFHADSDDFDEDVFLEVASEWLDDYKRVKASKAKKFRIAQHPMSGTDVVIDEV